MRWTIFLISFLLVFSSPYCKSQNKELKSQLVSFQYGGYGDTIFAFLGGRVFSDEGLKSPIDSVEIISYRDLPTDTSEFTDSLGGFLIGFCKGTFDIIIRKRGYQSIKLKNFESDPDQMSYLKAILRKGEGEVVFDISKKKI